MVATNYQYMYTGTFFKELLGNTLQCMNIIFKFNENSLSHV